MAIDTKISECQQCAGCCKDADVYVTSDEIKQIQEKTGLSPSEFTRRGQRNGLHAIADYYELSNQANEDCIFLVRNGLYACSIYDIRPGTCSEFPLNKRQMEFCEENKSCALLVLV